jgi:hypothetical protein
MDVSGVSSLSPASLHALFGQAMPTGAQATAEAGPTTPALAMEAAALAAGEALVATLMGSMTGPAAASLARSLASLSVLDPAAELARLTR